MIGLWWISIIYRKRMLWHHRQAPYLLRLMILQLRVSDSQKIWKQRDHLLQKKDWMSCWRISQITGRLAIVPDV